MSTDHTLRSTVWDLSELKSTVWDDRSRGVDLNPYDAYAGLLSFSLNFVHFPCNLDLNADYASKSESNFVLMNLCTSTIYSCLEWKDIA